MKMLIPLFTLVAAMLVSGTYYAVNTAGEKVNQKIGHVLE
jgi:hypothetical protein